MYIQPDREGGTPLSIPRNYSGSAFRSFPQEGPPQPSPPPAEGVREEESIEPSVQPPIQEETPAEAAAAPSDEEAVPAGAFSGGRDHHPKSLRNRFPFLSSLLPPPREKHKKDGILPEWALIGAVILLFLWEDEDNDILPFLLLLLLWD